MVKDSTTSTYSYNSLNQLTSRTTSGTTTNYVYSTNGNLFYKENEEIVITDEYNPVDFWWAETSFAWREKTQEMLLENLE